jgi:pimeloyl-ACP methyl ester carboxylesterase
MVDNNYQAIDFTMSAPALNYVNCPDASGGHRMAYWEWGNPAAGHVVMCVHGLTRQGRDFDILAKTLCDRSGNGVRVICPDVAGRGKSDWLQDPGAYQVPQYTVDMLALLAQLQPTTLDWVGTSMGGLIGMAICGQPDLPLPVPVRRLVLNDVGPKLPWEALHRIGTYLGQTGRFTSLQEAADALWAASSSFGPHTPEQWLAFSRPMVKPIEGAPGLFELHYDPAIAVAFSNLTRELAAQGEAILWQLYDNIKAATLLIRGAQSDLLSGETAQAMTQRGPRARLVTFEGVGHAPTFVTSHQVGTIADFILG